MESSGHQYPEWFQPLVDLKGFKRTAHKNAILSIQEGCDEASVNEAAVVGEFAEYYRGGGRSTNGWSDPVAALVRTLPVQIAKTRKGRPKSTSLNIDYAALKAQVEARQGGSQ